VARPDSEYRELVGKIRSEVRDFDQTSEALASTMS
jgi:hypothetical protein